MRSTHAGAVQTHFLQKQESVDKSVFKEASGSDLASFEGPFGSSWSIIFEFFAVEFSACVFEGSKNRTEAVKIGTPSLRPRESGVLGVALTDLRREGGRIFHDFMGTPSLGPEGSGVLWGALSDLGKVCKKLQLSAKIGARPNAQSLSKRI